MFEKINCVEFDILLEENVKILGLDCLSNRKPPLRSICTMMNGDILPEEEGCILTLAMR